MYIFHNRYIQLQHAMFKNATNIYHYKEFIELCQQKVNEQSSTSFANDDKFVHFSQLNLNRMLRLNKTFEVPLDAVDCIKDMSYQNWWVITEGWCGDSAQSLPVINKIAELNPRITLNIILREENHDIMDNFLTNGGRSIPKLIAEKDGVIRFVWGPRPEALQKLFTELKSKNTAFEELEIAIQKWYNEDKGHAILQELLQIED